MLKATGPFGVVLGLVSLIVLFGCVEEGVSRRGDQRREEVAGPRLSGSAATLGQGPLPGETGPGHGGHDEAEAGSHEEDEELVDLDVSTEVLFSLRCEHDLKTYECPECRYEVGVVKAPAELVEGGLIETISPQRRAVTTPLRLTGEVQFDERLVVHVTTQAEGIVRKVHVALGDRVERGQPLVELDSVLVGEAEAAYLEAKSLLELARRNLERLGALRREGIASEKEFLVAEQAVDTATIRTEAALGKLVRLGMPAPVARRLTRNTATGRLVLRAPSEGVVLQLHAVAGEIAELNESLATVGHNESVWVWANLYERDLARVSRAHARTRLEAEVRVKAYPDESFTGTVDYIAPALDERSRTIKVRVALSNPDGLLLAGMFADVDILLPGDRQALMVPAGAVLEDEGRAFVFAHHHGDYYVRRPVAKGRTAANWTEITEGLDGDETLVAGGSFLMKSDVLRSKMGAGCAD